MAATIYINRTAQWPTRASSGREDSAAEPTREKSPPDQRTARKGRKSGSEPRQNPQGADGHDSSGSEASPCCGTQQRRARRPSRERKSGTTRSSDAENRRSKPNAIHRAAATTTATVAGPSSTNPAAAPQGNRNAAGNQTPPERTRTQTAQTILKLQHILISMKNHTFK
jgi:hypothetical protein